VRADGQAQRLDHGDQCVAVAGQGVVAKGLGDDGPRAAGAVLPGPHDRQRVDGGGGLVLPHAGRVVLEIREAQARAERQRRRGDDPERDARLRTVGVDALGFSQEILEGNALPGAGFSPGSCSAWAVVYRRGVRWLAVTSLLAVGCAPMTTSDFPSDPRLQRYLLVATRALSGESFAFAFERAPPRSWRLRTTPSWCCSATTARSPRWPLSRASRL
jgi:hypothetical protein